MHEYWIKSILFNINKNSGEDGKLSPEFHWKVSAKSGGIKRFETALEKFKMDSDRI